MPDREVNFRLRVSEEDARELSTYLNNLSPSGIIFGLRFAYNRKSAEDGGYLMPGRKSFVKRETHLLSKEQAKWRLNNWKAMIKTYREKGYSYPTISRIKKEVRKVAGQK
ncbi:MAG TPA: hypothetical protein VJ742_01730 [Nitrososphaera sp.]|jgi:hypothetical protein|nr:hypothetical protein [Nitrososphaera sp.]